MYNECNSVNSIHKITRDEFTCHKNESTVKDDGIVGYTTTKFHMHAYGTQG